MDKSWAPISAIIIAVLTVLVFAAFGAHVLSDGGYEQRTVVAMSIRTLVWIVIAVTCWWQLLSRRKK